MAKSFISFLGTGDYADCRYVFNGQTGQVVKYIQEDMVQRFCSEWSETNEIRIFTTAEAKQKNWNDNGHIDLENKTPKKNSGLGKQIDFLNLTPTVKQVDIPIGNSEEEIWEIFNIVYNTMEEGEDIIFDITHSFRSIPMLFMVLAGYAGVMKNINISGIYYGAFETLGHPSQVVKQIPNPEDRKAPVFDLTSFVQLTDWSTATQSFIRHGIADDFLKLVNKKTGVVLRESRGRDRVAKNMDFFAKNMEKISRNMQYNRGARIVQHDYEMTMKNLQEAKKDPLLSLHLGLCWKKLSKKISGFKNNDIKNGFKAVEWCMEHGLIQQAVTMLQESITSYVLALEGLDWSIRKIREQAGSAIHFISKDGNLPDDIDSELAERLSENIFIKTISSDLQRLRVLRNDLNHGGFIMEEDDKSKSPEKIQRKFEEVYRSIKQNIF